MVLTLTKLDPFAISLADYTLPRQVANFHQEWDSIDASNDAVYEFELSVSLPGNLIARSILTAVDAVSTMIKLFAMSPAERSERLSGSGTEATHTLYLSGTVVGEESVAVLVRCRFASETVGECTVQVTARSLDPLINDLLAGAVDHA